MLILFLAGDIHLERLRHRELEYLFVCAYGFDITREQHALLCTIKALHGLHQRVVSKCTSRANLTEARTTRCTAPILLHMRAYSDESEYQEAACQLRCHPRCSLWREDRSGVFQKRFPYGSCDRVDRAVLVERAVGDGASQTCLLVSRRVSNLSFEMTAISAVNMNTELTLTKACLHLLILKGIMLLLFLRYPASSLSSPSRVIRASPRRKHGRSTSRLCLVEAAASN
jgi:hypothetical protein